MYVDSHVHFWQLGRGDYGWIPQGHPVLDKDRLPHELKPILDDNGVEAIVLVEAASTAAELEYMLALAASRPWIAGVVGGLDVLADDFIDQYERFRSNPRFVGIRINGSRFEETDGKRLRDNLQRGLERLEADGFALDLLARPQHLPAIAACLARVPKLKAVINHLGVPQGMSERQLEPWAERISQFRIFPHTFVKISGMITQAGGFRPELVEPYVAWLAEEFGPRRLMFGSDWPVALLAGSYEETVRLFEKALPAHWSPDERDAVRRGNAIRFYGLDAPGGTA